MTYSGSASNVPATTSSRTPERRAPERRAHGGPYSAAWPRSRPRRSRALDPGRLGHEHQPVREHGLGERLDVVGQRVVAPADQRARLGGAQQHQAGARRGAELHPLVGAGVAQQRDDVVAQRARGVHARARVLTASTTSARSATGSRSSTRSPRLVAGQHPGLRLGVRVAERERGP